jgi:uncharacterized protein RhaS with RHS repeats
LGHVDPAVGIYIGKVGIILCIHGCDLKGRSTATNRDHISLINRDRDLIIRQLSDDIKEQTGRHHADPGLRYSGIDPNGNTCLKIISGQLNTYTYTEENTLQARNRAFLCYGTACNGNSRNQQSLFTGKLHGWTPFVLLSLEKKGRIYIVVVVMW